MAIAILSVLLGIVCALFLRACVFLADEKKERKHFAERCSQLWYEKQQLDIAKKRLENIIETQNVEIEKLQKELSRYQSTYWPLDNKERN